MLMDTQIPTDTVQITLLQICGKQKQKTQEAKQYPIHFKTIFHLFDLEIIWSDMVDLSKFLFKQDYCCIIKL